MLEVDTVSLTGPVDLTDKTLSGRYDRQSVLVRFDLRNRGASPILVIDTLRLFDYVSAARKLTLWYGNPPPTQADQYTGYPNLVLIQPDAVSAVESELPALHDVLSQDDSGNLNHITYDLTQLTATELRIRWADVPLQSSTLEPPYRHILVQDVVNWGSELIRPFQQTVQTA